MLMGIWERLGYVIKSHINDGGDKIFRGNSGRRTPRGDPDLDAAYDELDDFLRGDDVEKKGSWGNARAKRAEKKESEKKAYPRPVPENIRQDLAELGLKPDATADQCKAAYKELLKTHHPDRHSKHPDNMKKANEKAARINAAYERLERWFKLMGDCR